MSKFIRIIFSLFYLICISLIYLSTVDKYDFLYDLDPALPHGSLTPNNSNGKVFAGLILFLLFIFQMLFIYLEKSTRWKRIISIMTVVAIVFFLFR